MRLKLSRLDLCSYVQSREQLSYSILANSKLLLFVRNIVSYPFRHYMAYRTVGMTLLTVPKALLRFVVCV